MSTPTLDPKSVKRAAPNVLIATTAMLSFISFWRAAAVVLNDMGSSAFYAGAIAEHFVGRTAPWFILAIMLLPRRRLEAAQRLHRNGPGDRARAARRRTRPNPRRELC